MSYTTDPDYMVQQADDPVYQLRAEGKRVPEGEIFAHQAAAEKAAAVEAQRSGEPVHVIRDAGGARVATAHPNGVVVPAGARDGVKYRP